MKTYFLLASLLLFISCSDSGMTEEGDAMIVIQDYNFEEGSTENSVFIKVSFTHPLKTNLLVEYSTSEGSAKAGDDFVPVESGTIIFSEGESEKEFEIVIVGDEIDEDDESFMITFTNPDIMFFEDQTIVVNILNDDHHIAELVIPGGYSSPLEYPGMSLVWSDEFQEDQLNEANWKYDLGTGCPGNCGWGNNELQYYQKENLFFRDNEYLIIQARPEEVLANDYTSTRLKSKGNQSFKYGRIDIRAVLPKGQGIWSALWMMGDNITSVGWPRCGEIDIVEVVGHDPNTAHGTFHYGNAYNDKSQKGNSRDATLGLTFSDEFHVFSIVWVEDKVDILLNDVVYSSITPQHTAPYSYPFNQPFYFLLNVAVGGDWPGSPNSTTPFPQHMIVDYIRVFQ